MVDNGWGREYWAEPRKKRNPLTCGEHVNHWHRHVLQQVQFMCCVRQCFCFALCAYFYTRVFPLAHSPDVFGGAAGSGGRPTGICAKDQSFIYGIRGAGTGESSPSAVRFLSLCPRLAPRSCVTDPIHHRLTHVNNISLDQPYKRAYPFSSILRHPWPFQPPLIPLSTLRH